MSTVNGGPQSIPLNGLLVYIDFENDKCYISGSSAINNLARLSSTTTATLTGNFLFEKDYQNIDVMRTTPTSSGYFSYSSILPATMSVITMARSNRYGWQNAGCVTSTRTAGGGYIIHPGGGTNLDFYLINSAGGAPIIGTYESASRSRAIVEPVMYSFTTNATNSHKVYINGVLTNTNTASIARNNTQGITYLGTDSGGFVGSRVSDISFYYHLVYNRVLSDEEMLSIYNTLTKNRTPNINFFNSTGGFNFLLQTGSIDLNSGLVLNLDAALTSSYTSGSSFWFDISGNNHTGSLINGTLFTGSNGGALLFDGINDYVSIPNSAMLNPGTGSFTIFCIFNSDPAIAGNGWDIYISNRTGGNNGYYVGTNNINRGTRIMIGNNINQRTDTGFVPYTNNTWMMATSIVNRDNGFQMIIKDNVSDIEAREIAGGTYSNAGNIFIGGEATLGSFTTGMISVVRMYNRALNTSEITELYNLYKDRYNL